MLDQVWVPGEDFLDYSWFKCSMFCHVLKAIDVYACIYGPRSPAKRAQVDQTVKQSSRRRVLKQVGYWVGGQADARTGSF